MRFVERWRIFRVHRGLVLETFAVVVIVRIALVLLPFRWVHGFATGEAAPVQSSTPAHIVWAVTAVARRVPGASCLTRVLAAAWLFARHGHPATVRLGVSGDGRIAAHAWLESEGRAMLDAPAPGTFAALA